MEWGDYIPAFNFLILIGVIIHLRRTSLPAVNSSIDIIWRESSAVRCLVTNDTHCLIFSKDIESLGLCDKCVSLLREKMVRGIHA
jgi:hypothetical protein